MDKAKLYIEANKERFINELFDLLRIPSISAEAARKPDMQRCAEWLAAALAEAGADRAEVMPTEGNPVVYAEKIVDPKAKTVLVYGHYDVMPVDPREEWRTEPFEPTIENGRIRGRGADDDKGQLWMQVKAFEAMCATGTLPCNVKFMLEGEEEIGSESLYGFCRQNKKLLKADIILVSDTSMLSMETPSITCGLRGLTYMEVEVTGPDKDLHSGLFGGAVANPANVLARLVAGLVDSEGRVTIPGFYDDVRSLTPSERRAFNKAPFDLAGYKRSLQIGAVEGEAGYTTLERTGIRPSLDVNGIWGGYTGEGTKTVIPSKATAKISIAAAVVAGRGVTLGVFVGQNRTHGFHHLVAHEVLRGDQLDAVGLTAPLGGDQIENPGISFHVDVFWNVGFFQCVKIIKFDENRPAHNLKYFSYLCVAETK